MCQKLYDSKLSNSSLSHITSQVTSVVMSGLPSHRYSPRDEYRPLICHVSYLSYFRVGELLSCFESGLSTSPKLGVNALYLRYANNVRLSP